jgi:uncharacterized membrane protein YsdA (DUF1294 family)
MPREKSKPRRKSTRIDPFLLFGLVTVGLALAVTAVLWSLKVDLLLSWLIAITLITFLTYGYDKAAARSGQLRVPERILTGLAFIGGTAGALVGMRTFHHKTAKASFQLRFWIVVAVQVLLIALYVYVRYGTNGQA